MLHIVLHEPEMPANTGNIGRTCVACGAVLHLIEPLGFRLNEKMIKRAGLDYWDKLDIEEHESLKHFFDKYKIEENNMFLATTKAANCYSDVNYSNFDEVFILFGKETKGLPEDLLEENLNKTIRIPMREHLRSLNLSNSVAIIVYEVLRQNGFQNLESETNYFNK